MRKKENKMNREQDINEFIDNVAFVLSRRKKSMQHNVLFSLNGPLKSCQDKLLEVHGISDTIGILTKSGIIYQDRGYWCLSKLGKDRAKSCGSSKLSQPVKKVSTQPENIGKACHRQVRFTTSTTPKKKPSEKKKERQVILDSLKRCILEELLKSDATSLSELRARNYQIHHLLTMVKEKKLMRPFRFQALLVREKLINRSQNNRGELILTKKGVELANSYSRFQSISVDEQNLLVDCPVVDCVHPQVQEQLHVDDLVFQFGQGFHI